MKNVTGADFDQLVLQADGPVLVDFWAEWCGPCKMLGTVLEEVAPKVEGKMEIVKCSVEDAGDIASRYGIMSIPALLVFNGGDVIAKKVGALTASDLEAFINENI